MARPDDPAALAGAVLEEEARRQDAQDERAPSRADVALPGVGGDELSLRQVVAAGGASTLAVLFSLNLVDEFDRAAMFVLGPEIQRSFNLSDAGLNAINGVGGILVFVAAVPFGVLADRRHRPTILGISSLLWALFAMAAGVTRQSWQLVATRVLNGLGKANGPVQSSLLADAYPLEGRARVFAVHSFANSVGNALGPILAGGIAAIAGGAEGWRWAFVALAVPSIVLAVLSFRLRDPKRGQREQMAILGSTFEERDELPIALGAAFARIRKIRTMYHLLVGVGALGFVLVGAPGIFNLFLEDRYGLDAFERGLVGTIIAVGSGIGFPIGGRFGDRLFRENPAKVMLLVGGAVAAFGVAYPIALYMPNLPTMVVALTVASAAVSAALVPASSLVASVVPFRLRGIGFSMFGIYLFLIGGFFGGILGGAMSDSLGERAALVILVPISCVIGGAIIARGSRFVRDDMAMIVEETTEELEENQRQADPDAATPMLQVRNLDFSYGPVQVLFDVSIDVWPGEVLALLGTNGAGKSTLLRAVSGLGQPDRGAIRIDGRTMTFTDARTRVELGIVQMPGGKAIFPGLSVRENLLVGAHTFTWDRARVERKIAEVTELFPKLGERLGQPAGTLSGGEQQMLALGKALLLEPQLLLIDELSLGLAPVVVQELLAIVERLKGTLTMVIVEQSVNVALTVADRAVFMEKGRIRFEGPAAELLERDDLVRAVFLGDDGAG